MATEYKLPFTAIQIKEKLEKVDELVSTVNGIAPNENGNIDIDIASSWNDLTDKPFGETTTTISDTLTWDGNITGREYIEATVGSTSVCFVHVSDTVPTLEELQNGGSFAIYQSGIEQEVTFTASNVLDVSAVGMGSDCYIVMNGQDPQIGVVLKEGATATMEGQTATFNKAGVYFLNLPAYNIYISEFTINNYTFVETEIKTIEFKYLPESHQFGEVTITTPGDTLTWDGDMTGKPVVTLDMGEDGVMNFCKVSEAVPTLEDMSNGVSATVPGMGSQELTDDMVTVGDGYIFASMATIISESNTLVEEIGLTFPETGIWLASQSGMYISEVKINGYTGFAETKTVVKKMDPKYLPDVAVEKLPESHQFGSIQYNYYGSAKAENGSIVWDGDTTGLFQINGMSCYLLTDDTRLFDFDGQITLTRFNPEQSASAFVYMSSDNVKLLNTDIDGLGILVASEDNALLEAWGITLIIPKKGTYAAYNIQMRIAAEGIDFGSEAIKTIDPKYLPSGFGGSTADTDEIVQEVLAALPTWEGGSY